MRTSMLVVTLIFVGLSSGGTAHAVTWCAASGVPTAVACNEVNQCHIRMNVFGGERWYLLSEPANPNKDGMVSLAVTALSTKAQVQFGFSPDGLNCADVTEGTKVFQLTLLPTS